MYTLFDGTQHILQISYRDCVGNTTWIRQNGFLSPLDKNLVDHGNHLSVLLVINRAATIPGIGRSVQLKHIERIAQALAVLLGRPEAGVVAFSAVCDFDCSAADDRIVEFIAALGAGFRMNYADMDYAL